MISDTIYDYDFNKKGLDKMNQHISYYKHENILINGG